METVPADVPIRVLIASSDPYMRCILQRALSRDHRFDVAGQVADGDSVVTQPVGFDLLVIDAEVAGLGVFGVMSRLSQEKRPPAVVVVARRDCPALRPAVSVEGGRDYLLIPRDLEALADRLEAAASAEGLSSSRHRALA